MKKIRKMLAGAALFAVIALQTATVLAEGDIVIVGTDGAEIADATVPNGVYIGNIPVSGMTAEQVGQAIDDYINTVNGLQLVVQSEKGSTQIAVADMALTCNNRDELIEAAIGNQHVGNLIAQYKQAKDLECKSLRLEMDVSVDASALGSYLISQIPDLESAPKNPSVSKDANGQFVFTEAVDGFSIDYDGTYEAVCDALADYDGTSGEVRVEVAGVATPSSYDMSVFEGFGDILGECSTNFSVSEESMNRATNVRLSASKINGTVLMPGETFSFCAAVQPFTAEEGYKDAGTYENGQTVDALGGGVCQVSTTLYDAVLWAELDIPAGGRKPHSQSVVYVEPSMDAMVYVATGSDFQFTNSTEHAIYIEAYTTAAANDDSGAPTEDVVFRIYGTEYRPANRTIDYESIVIEEEWPDPVYKLVYDDEAYDMYEYDPGREVTYNKTLKMPHKMVKSKLVKHVYIDGVEQGEAIYIHTDTYAMSSGELALNSKTTIKEIEYDPDTLGIIKLKLSNVYIDEAAKATPTPTPKPQPTKTEESTKEQETTKTPETTKAPEPTKTPTPTPTPAPQPTTEPASAEASAEASEE